MGRVFEAYEQEGRIHGRSGDDMIVEAVNGRSRRIERLRRNIEILASLLRIASGMSENEVRNKVAQMGGYGSEI